MANYILSTDNTNNSFSFQIGELKYSFRYPTTAELREMGRLNNELKQLVDDGADEATVEAKSKEAEAKMNELVTPVGHDNNIGDVLETQGINVVREFRKMMQKEISLE